MFEMIETFTFTLQELSTYLGIHLTFEHLFTFKLYILKFKF